MYICIYMRPTQCFHAQEALTMVSSCNESSRLFHLVRESLEVSWTLSYVGQVN